MEATHEGVSRRDQTMAAIIASRQNERDDVTPEAIEEVAEEIIEAEDVKDGVESVEDPGEVDAKKPVITFFDNGQAYEIPATAEAKLKVDGDEVLTPVDKVIRDYQKGVAGDKRLSEAWNMRQEVAKKEAELQGKLAELDQQKSSGDLSADDHAEKVSGLIKAVIDADEEAATEIFSALIPRPEKSDGDIDVDSIVDARIKENRQQENLAAAQQRFKDDYPELAEDDDLFALVDKKTFFIQQEKPEAEPWDIIFEAAEAVKKKFGTSKPPVKTKTPTIPVRSGRATIGEDVKPKTRKDILNDARKARGQPLR